MNIKTSIALIAIVVAATSCTSYYGLTAQFNKLYENDRYAESMAVADKTKAFNGANNAVLGHLNYATAAFWNRDYRQSIDRFGQADAYIDNHRTNWAKEALALITNPTVTPYQPEYFEEVMLHFYQAINYISLGEYEDAMVECRRMNLTLNRLSDNYKRDDHRHYARDAFGHYVMGILYEALDNANNAFIAYRNAFEAYTTDYAELFNTPVPNSLRTAMVRTATMAGLRAEARHYSDLFGIDANPDIRSGRLIAFVLQGFAPVKEQKNFTFVSMGGSMGLFNYTDSETGLTVPVDLSDRDRDFSPSDFKHVQLTLPRYTIRSTDAPCRLIINGVGVDTHMVEDINAIAPQSLRDRMWREVGKAIARMITKQAVGAWADSRNEWLGLAVSIVNAVTEQADTRYWQSLPAFIKITDMPLDEGEYNLQTSLGGRPQRVRVERGKTSFAIFKVGQ